jgi:prepilin-type N-terminal cleavage/methylation domain-containing protein
MRPPVRMRPTRGFTLVELLIVMVIIGILLAFILNAAMDGVRRAEERATQSLIIKLDTGIADRIEALLQSRIDPTQAHRDIAAIYSPLSPTTPIYSLPRAQVIAMYDMMKAELPDVFYFPDPTDPDYSASYPINFVATAWNLKPGGSIGDYLYPMDHSSTLPPPNYRQYADTPTLGAFGAAFTARAGLLKNLGNSPRLNMPLDPKGYDLIDNNFDGLIDDAGESGLSATQWLTIAKAHQHKTARAEMLYALLVEGQGPLGSVFNRDDFTNKEVRDTDGDGLPEFVDAWGQPLQFYRWPIFYHSDLQKGSDLANGTPPYGSVFEPREQDPLDPNQLLTAPSWWGVNGTSGPNLGPGALITTLPGPPTTPAMSSAAWMFHNFFHSLVEPLSSSGGVNYVNFWDRGSMFYPRRAFYTKFLIASSGPDGASGIARLDMFPKLALNVANLQVENQARQTDLDVGNDYVYFHPVKPGWVNPVTSNTLPQDGLDDITNHNLLAPGGGIQ